MRKNLSQKEEAFCQAVARLGHHKKVEAYKEAGYSQNLNPNAMGVQADKLYNKPKLRLRIEELTKKVERVAEEKFTISVEQRLKWLEEIVHAGMTEQTVMRGETAVTQRENLAASNQAIKTLNEMLGTDEKQDKVKPVKVFIGVEDASKS